MKFVNQLDGIFSDIKIPVDHSIPKFLSNFLNTWALMLNAKAVWKRLRERAGT